MSRRHWDPPPPPPCHHLLSLLFLPRAVATASCQLPLPQKSFRPLPFPHQNRSSQASTARENAAKRMLGPRPPPQTTWDVRLESVLPTLTLLLPPASVFHQWHHHRPFWALTLTRPPRSRRLFVVCQGHQTPSTVHRHPRPSSFSDFRVTHPMTHGVRAALCARTSSLLFSSTCPDSVHLGPTRHRALRATRLHHCGMATRKSTRSVHRQTSAPCVP